MIKSARNFFSSFWLLSLLLFTHCSSGQVENTSGAFKLVAAMPLINVGGRIDHFTFDSKQQRVFVAALGNNTVEVIDLANQKVIHTIKDLSEPQGVVFIPESNALLVANGGNGECGIFNAETFDKMSSVKLDGDADNVRYDSANNKIYAGYGDGGIAIIDASDFHLVANVKLSGHPESFQIDHAVNKIYVNVPDENQIDVIDLTSNKIADKWKMTEAQSNFPMALDETNHRLLVGCRRPAKLLVIDTQTGKTISSLSIDSDVDDVWFDSSAHQIYLSCGGGYIDVVTQQNADTYKIAGHIATHTGARTSLWIPELQQLIVAAPSGYISSAQLLIYAKQH